MVRNSRSSWISNDDDDDDDVVVLLNSSKNFSKVGNRDFVVELFIVSIWCRIVVVDSLFSPAGS